MKRVVLFIGIAIIFPVNHALAVKPENDTASHPVLIINAFDPSGDKSRKNKKELFAELADSLSSCLNSFISGNTEGKSMILPDLLKDTSTGNMETIMDQYKASIILVIMDLNVYFEQTKVDVTRNRDGSKTREASYDICCLVRYAIYRPGFTAESAEERNCEFFTHRNVASGLLAAGPDIVGKKKYTYEMVRKNARHFVFMNQLDN